MDRPDEPKTTLMGSALEQLSQEHDFIQPLLERLVDIGARIRVGGSVPPRTAFIGVALLDAYLHRVHISEEDKELRLEAEAVALPRCTTNLGGMTTNHREMCRRTQETLTDIRRWASGNEEVRPRVGNGIMELVSKDYEAVRYEETYALSCLQTELPQVANERLAARFADHAGTRNALEVRIGRFLAGTYTT